MLYGIMRPVNPISGIRIDKGSQPLVSNGGDSERRETGDNPLVGYSSKPSNNSRYANLSFLRLVGISEGAGVSFVVRGVFSDQQVKDVHMILLDGLKRFWTAYLKPMNMCIQVSTKETT